MKKVFTIFFCTLGVVFFVLLLILGYLFVMDPLELKPVLFPSEDEGEQKNTDDMSTVDKNSALTPQQEGMLEMVGIDPATVPTSVTTEQEDCFIELFGEARVEEITAGDSPTTMEIIKGKECIK